MKTVYFRWWDGKRGSCFTSLHATRKAAKDFLVAGLICWVSRPREKIHTAEVTNAQYKNLIKRLEGQGGGIRLQWRDLKK